MQTDKSVTGGRNRILLLGTQMTVGGAQRSLLNLGDGLHARGWDVTAAFLYDKDDLEDTWQHEHAYLVLNADVWRKGGGAEAALRLPGGLLRLRRLMRDGRFDAIVTYTQHSALIGIPCARLAGIPARIAANRGRIQGIPRWMERLHGAMINSRLTARLTVNSNQVLREAQEIEGVRAEKIVFIPNGVEVPAPFSKDERYACRMKLSVPTEAPVLISVGRLSAQKGQRVLIDALAQVKTDIPQIVLLMVGDGEERKALEARVKNLDLEKSVHFLGTRRDAADLMAAADVFVLPSFSEGMPNALLEAAARGLPSVCSDLEGVHGPLQDGETGLLVPPGDAPALAAAMKDLLEDPQKRANMGATARRHMQSNYSLEKTIDAYERLLHDEIRTHGN